ncbi:MAG: ribosome-associated translation inhibitor RaiA [Tissierellia bacterium]|nr:ribosome-associated translation inhibitor RaiA [Tissierellia bacterium]
MKFEINGKNFRVDDDLRQRVEEKLSKYSPYFNEEVTATVNFSQVKNLQNVEITIPLKNGAIIRVEEQSFEMLTSIDRAVEKLDRQIRKHKTALRKRYQAHDSIRFEGIPEAEEDEREEIQIVRTKNFPIKPMSPEEAVMQMELIGHDFFVFLNAETDEVNVVYKRKNGGYGLIEPIL